MFTELIKKRIFAYLIDGVVISTPLYIVGIIYWDYILTAHPSQLSNFALSLQFIPFFLYFFVSEMFFGKTLGKKLMKLKVIQTENKNKFTTITNQDETNKTKPQSFFLTLKDLIMSCFAVSVLKQKTPI